MVTGVCVLDFSEGGVSGFGFCFFFAFKHFQTTKQRLSIKKGKLFFALHILST